MPNGQSIQRVALCARPGGPTTIFHKGLYHNKMQAFFVLEVIHKLYNSAYKNHYDQAE
jgi:hypothetical protein